MSAKDLTLILVRMGPTTWDMQGRLCGCTDLPPVPGCLESLRVAIGVAEPDVDMVLRGPGEMAEHLANLLVEGRDVKVKSLEGLTDVGVGLWEGMLAEEAERRYPTLYRQWRLDPVLATPPEGEPVVEAQERLLSSIRKGVGRIPAKGRRVVVLLRPLAFGATVAALEGNPTSGIWAWAEGADRLRRVTIPGGDLRGVLDVRARIGA